VTVEIVAHRANDEATLRRYLAAKPDAIEVDVVGLVVAHELDLSDASGLMFDDVLALAGETPVVVEVKSPDGAGALQPYLDRIRVISFHEQVLRDVAGRAPTTILFADAPPAETVADTLGPHESLVTAELARSARVVPWTVNDPARMRELIALGVAGLTTDEPELARRLAHELSSSQTN
jgi:glycerophosphoryl diester phosphodiesterase